jgi:hypothetical protein
MKVFGFLSKKMRQDVFNREKRWRMGGESEKRTLNIGIFFKSRDFKSGDFKSGDFISGDFKSGDFKKGDFKWGDFFAMTPKIFEDLCKLLNIYDIIIEDYR